MRQLEINTSESSFFNAISCIDPLVLQEKSFDQTVSDGLEAYKRIEGCDFASLYTLNQQNFDFQFGISTSGVSKETVEDIFKLLADSGGIANSLSTGEITFWQINQLPSENYFLIIPLIIQSGVTGLIILSLNENFTGQNNIIELCRIYSNYFALLMQNHFLIEEIQNINLLSEQKITTRTNKIVKSTRELKSILDTVQAGIIIVDKKKGEIADANLAAIQLAGVLKEEIVGTDISALFISTDGSAKSNNFAINLEELLIKKDGTLVPVIKTVAGIVLGDEEFIIESFVDITVRKKMEVALQEAHDELERRVEERTLQLSITNQELQKEITERIKIEQELIAAKEKAEQSDKLKSNILANMQHEFRTPLIGIQGFSKILMDEIEDDEHRGLSTYIHRSGQRLLNTLNSVLYMSKFAANNISVMLEKQNLSEVISLITPQFETAAGEKNLEFKVCLLDEIFSTIDRDLFSQAIINLIDNAIKFTKKGSVLINIEKADKDDGKWALINIADTGIGIKESEQSLIFSSFRQVSEGYSREYEGNGLGLTLAKKMIELLNGKITVVSKINIGSTFTVWLPIEN